MTIDFERGAKTTGSKFYFLTGEDAVREWNLINYMLEYHQKNGYTFVIPPYMVRKEVGEWAGILPRFDGDYYTTDENRILIPTAETPLVGMHADEIFEEKDLPIKYVAFSPCFRKEAGAGGQKDKGLKRVHQFHKVELFIICRPEDSAAMQEQMIVEVTQMLKELELTVRAVELTEEDRSPVSTRTVDLELLVGGEWLEVSSISNMQDRQSKPAQIRYRPEKGGKNIKVHMLNGSGVALPRLQLAVIEKENK
jgi:seryl-tRNA synthetase